MIRHLVLLGAGPGHHHFLQSLLKKRSTDIAITLLTRSERHIKTAAFLRALAGQAPIEHCGEALEPLLRKTRVNWLNQNVQAIDASAKVLVLDDGRELRFDWLSIDLEPPPSRDLTDRLLPGARANALFMWPREAFCKLWPKVAELATRQPLRVVVIGGRLAEREASTDQVDGMTPVPDWDHEKLTIELAFAVRQAFRNAAVTLITGGQPVAATASLALRNRIQQALKKHRITVLADAACGVLPGSVQLRSGAHMACDVPLLALQGQTHPLLAMSGLALDDMGSAEVDGGQRSRSHAYVFATNGAGRADARSAALSSSLQAVVAGNQPKMFRQKAAAFSPDDLQTLRVGHRQAIFSWRGWAWSSRLLGGMMR